MENAFKADLAELASSFSCIIFLWLTDRLKSVDPHQNMAVGNADNLFCQHQSFGWKQILQKKAQNKAVAKYIMEVP